jgi:hypothetical protein
MLSWGKNFLLHLLLTDSKKIVFKIILVEVLFYQYQVAGRQETFSMFLLLGKREHLGGDVWYAPTRMKERRKVLLSTE